MIKVMGWTVDADEVVNLPLGELAFRVLQNVDANGETSNVYDKTNWLFGVRKIYRGRSDALRALAEAWEWLRSHGLIIADPTRGGEWLLITRLGRQVLAGGLPLLRAVHQLDADLVPALRATARPQFLRGDFETAVFVAMKEVEVRVRDLADLPTSLAGAPLMQEAFRPPAHDDRTAAGPLWQSDADGGEAVATMEVFKGAVGLFKNPSSHRRVSFDDPTEAAEIVLLADLLLRILDRISSSAEPASE